MFTLLITVIVIALIFDLVNGFHDAANSIATVVSTKVLTPFQAVVWAACFNVLAFWVFDMSVGNTVAKTVDNNAIDLWVILAGLIAATFWNLLTWRLGIPSSSSHTLIGGFAGAAVAHAGWDVIATGEILKVILFIFLAPLIGGFMAFLICLVTIARSFWKKMIFILILSAITIALMQYMIEYVDMKPIMLYIVAGMLAVFIIVYIWFELKHGTNKPSALKESHMHKRLQLLSSAAFSLGHGGADSQKVMGIICAALLVYGNMGRGGGLENPIPKGLQITELMQVEYKNEDGKIEKFKPEIAVVNGKTYFVENKAIHDEANGKMVYNKKGNLNPLYLKKIAVPSFNEIDSRLTKIEVYSFGDALCDSKSRDTIFNDKILNKNYKYAGIFASVIENESGELKKGYKIKTKVQSETMPFWIAFGCYLMIGLGTLMGGWKIVKTMGTKITKVTPLEGVCAETAGALTLFTVSQFGIPVSTTHTIAGSIIGVGATKRLSAVRWGVTINLLWAWILTIPVSALLAGLIYYIIVLFK
jgi:inorganic phosphate transporter, PiT family